MSLDENEIDLCKAFVTNGGEVPIESVYLQVNRDHGLKIPGFFNEDGRQMQVIIEDPELAEKCIAYLEQLRVPEYTAKELLALEEG